MAKTLYDFNYAHEESHYLIYASSKARAWAWMARNMEESIAKVKREWDISIASTNEAG